MENTEMLLGPPGTGKTTALLDIVDKCLEEGIAPGEIGFISFTKKSVEEAKSRAAARFGKSPRQFHYFRTIHSLAFQQLGMHTYEIMQRNNYLEIGEMTGLEIKGYQQMDREFTELCKGDQMIFLESLARLCCVNYLDMYQDVNPDFSFEEFSLLSDTLIQYKKKKLLYDFTDMLQRFHTEGVKPRLKMLLVDEAQDLCPIQWKIVEQLSAKSDQVRIAGDDDQAIFRWSGADVDYFISKAQKVKIRVLSQSYRLPSSIYKVSMEIVGRIQNRTKKEFSPMEKEGRVEFASSIEEIDMGVGEWLILMRNSYMEKGIVSHIRACGYSYESRWDNPNKSETYRAAVIWEKFRAIGYALVKDAKEILLHTRLKSKKLLKNLYDDDSIRIGEFSRLTGISSEKIWYEALDDISYEDQLYFIAARKRGESLAGKPRVRISTIHGAKGGECQNVVVLTDISGRTHKGMMNNPDDESRVFYVAMTRAKECLYIVQPQTRCYFPI